MTTDQTFDMSALDHEPDHRPMRYVEFNTDGTPMRVVYRASSLGGCERAFVACATGHEARPHPQWFQNVLDEGTFAEAQINAWWEAATSIPTVLQQQELILTTAIEADVVHDGATYTVPVVVKAHVDGFAEPTSGMDRVTVREYKKFRPSTYPNFQRQGVEVHKNYPWQIAAVMHAIRQVPSDPPSEPLVEMVGALWGKRDGEGDDVPDHVIDTTCHMIDMPPIPMKAINKKIARIEGLIADGYMPQDVDVVCAEDSYPCPYWYLHPSELAGGKKADKPVTKKISLSPDDPVALALIHRQGYDARVAALESDLKKIKQARDEVNQQIERFLEERGIDPHNGSARINNTIVERLWQERRGYEVKPTVVQRLVIKNADDDKPAKKTTKKTTNKETTE